MAHEAIHLLLLPLGPDKVHGTPLHGARRLPYMNSAITACIIQYLRLFSKFPFLKHISFTPQEDSPLPKVLWIHTKKSGFFFLVRFLADVSFSLQV